MMKIHKLVKHLSRIYHRVIDITIQSKTKFKLQKKNDSIDKCSSNYLFIKNIRKI